MLPFRCNNLWERKRTSCWITCAHCNQKRCNMFFSSRAIWLWCLPFYLYCFYELHMCVHLYDFVKWFLVLLQYGYDVFWFEHCCYMWLVSCVPFVLVYLFVSMKITCVFFCLVRCLFLQIWTSQYQIQLRWNQSLKYIVKYGPRKIQL